jgi:hypothetical protein
MIVIFCGSHDPSGSPGRDACRASGVRRKWVGVCLITISASKLMRTFRFAYLALRVDGRHPTLNLFLSLPPRPVYILVYCPGMLFDQHLSHPEGMSDRYLVDDTVPGSHRDCQKRDLLETGYWSQFQCMAPGLLQQKFQCGVMKTSTRATDHVRQAAERHRPRWRFRDH